MTDRIALILDDDRDHVGLVADCLRKEEFDVVDCSGLPPEEITRKDVDLCVIGSRASGRDGYELVRELRASSPAGIVMLSKSADETDIVLALEMGADDYMVKPVRPREFCARIRAILRRIVVARSDATGARPLPESFLLRVDDVELCGVLRTVSVGDRVVDLTPGEYDVLMVLAAHTNAVLSRERIIASARGGGHAINERAVDGIISRLRRKLFASPEEGARRIRTVHGRGYMLTQGG